MGHRLKVKRFRDDIEKTEQSIAALQGHLRSVKRQLASIVPLPTSQCDPDVVVLYGFDRLSIQWSKWIETWEMFLP